jgi:hypothetical protein
MTLPMTPYEKKNWRRRAFNEAGSSGEGVETGKVQEV